jgi:hypothetical protein
VVTLGNRIVCVEDPVKNCKVLLDTLRVVVLAAVAVLVYVVVKILAPYNVVAPVPPEVIGNVPVVNAEVDVAYIAPPEVKLVSAVPPAVVGSVPVVKAEVDVA